MIRWLSRFASRAVQKAHARVTAENARYVAEAIERLTQERNRAHAAATELLRKQERMVEIQIERMAELDDLREQVEALRERLAACEGWVCEPAVDLRARLKATSDDWARERRRWDGHAAVCPVAQQLDDVDRDKRLENQ